MHFRPGTFTPSMPIALVELTPELRRQIEDLISDLFALLDAADPDPDFEIDEPDCCSAFEDDLELHIDPSLGPGDRDDAEEDDWPGGGDDNGIADRDALMAEDGW